MQDDDLNKMRLLKCRVELRWIYDIFLFGGFLLLTILIPYEQIRLEESLFLIGIGLMLNMGISKGLTRKWVILVTILITFILYLSDISLYLPEFILTFSNFFRFYFSLSTCFLLGNVLGAGFRNLLNYWLCKRGG